MGARLYKMLSVKDFVLYLKMKSYLRILCMGKTWLDVDFGCSVKNVLKMAIIAAEEPFLKLLNYLCIEKIVPRTRIMAEKIEQR